MDFGVGWMHPGNIAPTEVRTPDRPARSISLYQLHYPMDAIKNVKDLLTS